MTAQEIARYKKKQQVRSGVRDRKQLGVTRV
jgi:hypothetical protein